MDISFADKCIFITGHTGFIGSWLTLSFIRAGAKVTGLYRSRQHASPIASFILDHPLVTSYKGDIRDQQLLETILKNHAPDYIIHLTAQADQGQSQKAPLETFDINVLGTITLLEAIRKHARPVTLLTAGSFPDPLQDEHIRDHSPYICSKHIAEEIIETYQYSYFDTLGIRSISLQLNNIIGGGDFNYNRIVPYCFYSWYHQKKVRLNHPGHIRRWSSVTDLVSEIKEILYNSPAYNVHHRSFGLRKYTELSVAELAAGLGLAFLKLNPGNQHWPLFTGDNIPLELINNFPPEPLPLIINSAKWFDRLYKNDLNIVLFSMQILTNQ